MTVIVIILEARVYGETILITNINGVVFFTSLLLYILRRRVSMYTIKGSNIKMT